MIRRGILARAKAGMADLRAASRFNRPERRMDGDALRVEVSVRAVCEAGTMCYASVHVDMETGREIIAAAEEIVERRLALAPRRERPARG